MPSEKRTKPSLNQKDSLKPLHRLTPRSCHPEGREPEERRLCCFCPSPSLPWCCLTLMPPGPRGLRLDVAFGCALAVVIETGRARAWRGRLAFYGSFKCGSSPRVMSSMLQAEVMPLQTLAKQLEMRLQYKDLSSLAFYSLLTFQHYWRFRTAIVITKTELISN